MIAHNLIMSELEISALAAEKWKVSASCARVPRSVPCVDELRYIDTKVQWLRSRWVAYSPVTDLS